MKTLEDGSTTPDIAQFQMFQCRHAPTASSPDEDAGGRTLFANTAMIYQQVFANDTSPYASEVKSGKWTVWTPANTAFGGDHIESPIVQMNPLSGRSILRWHEHWCVEFFLFRGQLFPLLCGM